MKEKVFIILFPGRVLQKQLYCKSQGFLLVRNGDFRALPGKNFHVLDEQEVSCSRSLHTFQADSKIHFSSNSVCC